MSSFTPSGSGGVAQLNTGAKQNPQIQNVTLVAAATEYTITTPSDTVEFTIRARQRVEVKLAWSVGTSGTTYMTLAPGTVYTQSELAPGIYTLYVQSPSSGSVVELETWTT